MKQENIPALRRRRATTREILKTLTASGCLILTATGCRDDGEDSTSQSATNPEVACADNEDNDDDSLVDCDDLDCAASPDCVDSFGRADGGDTGDMHFGAIVNSTATYYDADGSGACMFDPSPNDLDVAALTELNWSSAAWCGACADVHGPDGSVRIRIVDRCPECPDGHLDLSPQAFEQIAELHLGRIDITWQFVACNVSGPVTYKYKDGSNEWWTAVQVRNHRLPITAFEWSKDGNEWHQAVRTDYNYFLAEGGFGDESVQVRITAIDGQVLADELPPVQSELAVEGHAQFD